MEYQQRFLFRISMLHMCVYFHSYYPKIILSRLEKYNIILHRYLTSVRIGLVKWLHPFASQKNCVCLRIFYLKGISLIKK